LRISPFSYPEGWNFILKGERPCSHLFLVGTITYKPKVSKRAVSEKSSCMSGQKYSFSYSIVLNLQEMGEFFTLVRVNKQAPCTKK
jgi:hypothetical protein